MNGIALALSIVAVVLSLALATLEWYRYHIPLQMKLTEVHYCGVSGGNHLVLLWLAFVNPSSSGKTVFHIQAYALGNEVVSTCPYQFDRERDIATFQLPESDRAFQIAKNELLWLPLDLPPHRSAIRALPVLIKIASSANVNQSIHMGIRVSDVLGKHLASIDKTIELKTYQLF